MRVYYKKFLLSSVLSVFLCLNLFSFDFSFKITPSAVFPFASGSEIKYAPVGGAGFFDAGMTFFDYFNFGPELGYCALPIYNSKTLEKGKDTFVSIIPFGLQASAFYYPLSRMEISGGVSAGVFLGLRDDLVHTAPWYRVYANAGFRVTPSLTIGLDASWFDCQGTTYIGKPGAAGLTTGVSVKYVFETEKKAGGLKGEIFMDENVFPVFQSLYKDNPFGTIEVRNNETAEIRNVTVKFRSENYTSADMECGSVDLIKKGKKEEFMLYADFSDSIFRFTEAGQIAGEIVVEYELLGEKKTSVTEVIVPVYNRNQIRWSDPSAVSSFVAYTGDDVMGVSKELTGFARGHLRSGLNPNLQFAMYLFEGMKLAGITYEAEEATPYDSTHQDYDAIDNIQYPYQTMMYKSGDKDDIGILYMAFLQSVGIHSAFIPLEDEFIIAFNMEVNAAKAQNYFDGYDRIIVYDDSIWIPVAMSSIGEGFVNSWYKAVVAIQKKIAADEDIPIFVLDDCWSVYKNVTLSISDSMDMKLNNTALASAVDNDISRYITAEFGPQIAAIQNRIKAEGGSVELYNKLGMLYVRAGMYSSAIPVYELSAKQGSIGAMNNLGNIASLQKRTDDAKKWYQKVLEIDPTNKTALKNLERIAAE